MLTIEKPRIMWAWVCPITGMVWDEGWAATEGYARNQTQKTFGKRRMEAGDMRLVRVTIEPLTDTEAEAYKAEYAEWRAKKDAQRAQDA